MTTDGPLRPGGVHRALVYEDARHFDQAVTSFVLEGLERDERVLVFAVPEKLGRLRSALDPAARAAVQFADADNLYHRQGRIIRAAKDSLDAATAGGRRARLVAEQALASRSAAEVAYYLRLEAASNALFAPYPVTVLCPYDAATLPASVLEGCQQTHPALQDGASAQPSHGFVDPRRFVVENIDPVDPPADAAAFAFDRAEDLVAARSFLRARAVAAGLAETAVAELVTGANEVLTNAILHGEGPRQLWTYLEDGALVVHVRDHGRGFADVLGAYLPPDLRSGREDGRGIWIAHQTSDAVEFVTCAAWTDVRLLTTLDRRPVVQAG